VHYQSLYRRFRPQRFGDVLGQEHVSETLRNAVATDKVAHAYLFSGPRGCGKTTSARILAKALNCTNLADGEPCNECDSCIHVVSGASMDVIELDAASNNGVDAMRDLVSRAALGTAGRRKVYIVDEVHMLSTAASNALLKTLEEPPDHVVFVLATTDPQKVLPTVRSRTQQFEFRLFPFDTLLALVRSVAVEAGIDLDDATLAAVTRRGNGSARDALSALDQAAAAGGMEDGFDVSELVHGLAVRDSTAVLLGVDRAAERGRDTRQLARDVIDVLRTVFLAHMGRPSAADADLVRALSPASATRALETIGEALIDMRDSLDPRVVLEVALIRLCRADLDASIPALLERIERLERGGFSMAAPALPAAVAPVSSAPAATPPTVPPTPDEVVRVPPVPAPPVPAPPVPAPPVPAPPVSPQPAQPVRPQPAPSATRLPPLRAPESETPAPGPRRAGAADAARAQLGVGGAKAANAAKLGAAPGTQARVPAALQPPSAPVEVSEDAAPTQHEQILDRVSRRARTYLAAGAFTSFDGDTLSFLLPNAMHLDRAREFADELTEATAAQLGRAVRVSLSAGADFSPDDSESAAPGVAPPPAPLAPLPPTQPVAEHQPEDDHDVDLDSLVDAPADADRSVLDQIASAFPGAQIVES
jgi:DNA polymerase III subunit gamma/tau